MNICIITTGYPTPIDPGKYAFVDQLACAWADMGSEVTVIYPIPYLAEVSDKKRFYRSKWKRNTFAGNVVSVYSPRYFSASDMTVFGLDTNLLSYRSFQNTVIHTIKQLKRKPDMLYAHFLSSGCQAGDIGLKLDLSSFCAFGESSLWSIEGRNIEKVKNSLSKLSGIISVSTENKRVLVENELFRESDIGVFPNGVDHSIFFRRDKREVRLKHGFPEDAFIGTFTGSFSDDKGVLRAQEAAIRAGNVPMIYIGGGTCKPEGSNILFCEKLQHEEIAEFLSAADFFILPTKAEGCCNAIIEAMACGLPIISANGAYNDDILTDDYSIRTDPTDIAAMTEAIEYLRGEPRRRFVMSEAAQKASMRFNISDRAKAIIEFMKHKSRKG